MLHCDTAQPTSVYSANKLTSTKTQAGMFNQCLASTLLWSLQWQHCFSAPLLSPPTEQTSPTTDTEQ